MDWPLKLISETTTTSQIDNNWKLVTRIYSNNKAGQNRYHYHDGRWCPVYNLKRKTTSSSFYFVCSHCNEPVPDDIEGFANLVEWGFECV